MPTVATRDAIPVDERAPKGLVTRSILIVEDNVDLAEGISQLLVLEGALVRIAGDGVSAISLARAAVPDLIVCDLGLPGSMDGYAVARACRADSLLKGVRLVAVSGYGSPEKLAETLEAGFESFLVKPLTEDSLRALVQ